MTNSSEARFGYLSVVHRLSDGKVFVCSLLGGESCLRPGTRLVGLFFSGKNFHILFLNSCGQFQKEKENGWLWEQLTVFSPPEWKTNGLQTSDVVCMEAECKADATSCWKRSWPPTGWHDKAFF